jgi:hypothetical protein
LALARTQHLPEFWCGDVAQFIIVQRAAAHEGTVNQGVDSLARSQIMIDASLMKPDSWLSLSAGRDTPTLLKLVEEPFDQVTRPI